MTYIPRFEAAGRAPAYSYPFASSLRNSRVDVPRRKLQELSRVPLEHAVAADAPTSAPSRITVSPDGRHLVLRDRSARYLALNGEGRFASDGYPAGSAMAAPVALNDWVATEAPYDWSGARSREYVHQALVFRLDEKEYVTACRSIPGAGDIHLPDSVILERSLRNDTSFLLHGWTGGPRGFGIAGAIDAEFHMVLAMQDGPPGNAARVEIYSPKGNAEKQGVLLLKRTLPFVPTDLSLVPPYVALLEKTPSGGRVHLMEGDGDMAWEADVPFPVHEPPIDGADGRVYLVGDGLTTIDGGKVVSTVRSELPMYATAFADGSLAVAVGHHLQLVARSGTIEQQFETAEPIVTPPAIAANGDVWVATDSAVYVAR